MANPEVNEKLKKMADFRSLIATSVISALAFVVALFWNDAIRAAIEQIIPKGEGVFYKLLAAIVVTLIVVVIIYIIMHSQKMAEQRLREIKEAKEKKRLANKT